MKTAGKVYLTERGFSNKFYMFLIEYQYPAYLISKKNPFSGRCIFLCIFLATACSFLYNFWPFWNFRPNVPTLNCSKCHEIFTVCKKENIFDIVRHWILWPTTWIFINPKLRKWPNVPLRNHCEGLLNGHILTK